MSQVDTKLQLLADFRAGKLSRRRFLQLLAAVTGGAAVASIPAVGAAPLRQIEPKILVYGASQDIATIDPGDRTDYSIGAIVRQLYDRLFRFEGGWPQPVEPSVCTSWSASDDARVWTFNLTDKAVFHDGTPLTAADVVYSYQRTLRLQRQRSSLLSTYLTVDGITAPDDYTVVMNLTTPYGSFDRLLAFIEQPIINSRLAMANEVNGDDATGWLVDHEAGSGPFVIKNWQIGSVYELEAVPDYWGGWPGEGRLSGVVWRKTEDPGTRKAGLLSGEFDVSDTISVTDIDEINNSGVALTTLNYGLLAGYLKMNNQAGPTADVNFRKFLAYSFDREAFAQSQEGFVKLMTGPIPEGVDGYDPNIEPQYTYNPELARQHLEMSPYAAGGFSLDFVYVSGLDFEEIAGLIFLAELQKYNITLNMVPKNWPDIVGACNSPETGPDIAFIFDQFPPLADTWLIEKYNSASWDRPTGGSFQACTFYKNEAVNAKLEELRLTTDRDASLALIGELQAMISADAPDIPIYVTPNILGFSNRVRGYTYFGDISVDFWRLWIED